MSPNQRPSALTTFPPLSKGESGGVVWPRNIALETNAATALLPPLARGGRGGRVKSDDDCKLKISNFKLKIDGVAHLPPLARGGRVKCYDDCKLKIAESTSKPNFQFSIFNFQFSI